MIASIIWTGIRGARGGNVIADGTADAPGGMRDKGSALGVIKGINGVDQAQITLLKQIQKKHTMIKVLHGDGNHQMQIGLCQTLLGAIALFDTLFRLSNIF